MPSPSKTAACRAKQQQQTSILEALKGKGGTKDSSGPKKGKRAGTKDATIPSPKSKQQKESNMQPTLTLVMEEGASPAQDANPTTDDNLEEDMLELVESPDGEENGKPTPRNLDKTLRNNTKTADKGRKEAPLEQTGMMETEGEEEVEVVEVDGDDSTVIAGVGNKQKRTSQKLLQGFRPLTRTNTVFVDIRLNLPKSKKSTETARKAMKLWYETCRERDSDMILYVYEQKCVKESDALVDIKAIPESINQIDKYFSGYRPRSEAGISYMSARIGFSTAEDTFFSDLKVLLAEEGHAMYKKNIQAAHTANVGWIWGGFRDLDLDYMRDWFETIFFNYDCQNKVTRKTPLKLGLWSKPIWDGTKKSDRPTGKKGIYGCHVDTEVDCVSTVHSYLRRAMASSEFAKCFGIKMHLIPRLTFSASPNQRKKFQAALMKHAHLQACLERAYTWELGEINRPSQQLGMVTLRELVFRWKAKGTNEQLFVGIDKKWGKDGGYTFTFPKKFEAEAREKLSCLPAYLQKQYGD